MHAESHARIGYEQCPDKKEQTQEFITEKRPKCKQQDENFGGMSRRKGITASGCKFDNFGRNPVGTRSLYQKFDDISENGRHQ